MRTTVTVGARRSCVACTPCATIQARNRFAIAAHAYVSAAFRPNTGLVELAALETEHAKCVKSADASPRCALFHAIFELGAVSAGSFPSDTETFF